MKKVISLFTALFLALSLFNLPAAAFDNTYTITHNYYLDGVLAGTNITSGTIGDSDWEIGYTSVSALTSPVYNGNTYTFTGAESDGASFTDSTVSYELLQSSGLTLNYSRTTPPADVSFTVTHVYSYTNGDFIGSDKVTHTIKAADLSTPVSISSLEQTLFHFNTFTFRSALLADNTACTEESTLNVKQLSGGLTIDYTIDKMKTVYTVQRSASSCEISGLNSSYLEGDKVSFSVSPSSGYVISKVYYTYGNYSIKLTPDFNGLYSFIMPAKDITLYVVCEILRTETVSTTTATTTTTTTSTAVYKGTSVSATVAAGSTLAVGGASSEDIQSMKEALEQELTMSRYANGNFAVLPISITAVEISATSSIGQKTSVTDVTISNSINTDELMKLLGDLLPNESSVGTVKSESSGRELLWQGGDKDAKNMPEVFLNEVGMIFALHKSDDGTVDIAKAELVDSLDTRDSKAKIPVLDGKITIRSDAIDYRMFATAGSPFAIFLVVDEEKLAEYLAETDDEGNEAADVTAETDTDNKQNSAELDGSNNTTEHNDRGNDTNPPTGVGLGLGAALAAGFATAALRKRKAK